MTNPTLLLVLAFAGIATAAPVEKVSYEWLSPDLTTVLCSSLVPGSCDPYDAATIEVEERFLGSHTQFEVGPELIVINTQIAGDLSWSGEETEGRRLRLRYSFELEWDLGTYAFVRGTGDFLTQYEGQCGRDNYRNEPWFSFSVSSPFPTDDLCRSAGDVKRLETYGKPFQHKGNYRVFLDKIDPVPDDVSGSSGPFPGYVIRWVSLAFDPDTGDLIEDISPQLVQVAAPIPEPAGLTIAGLVAILSAAAVRRARCRSRDA